VFKFNRNIKLMVALYCKYNFVITNTLFKLVAAFLDIQRVFSSSEILNTTKNSISSGSL